MNPEINFRNYSNDVITKRTNFNEANIGLYSLGYIENKTKNNLREFVTALENAEHEGWIAQIQEYFAQHNLGDSSFIITGNMVMRLLKQLEIEKVNDILKISEKNSLDSDDKRTNNFNIQIKIKSRIDPDTAKSHMKNIVTMILGGPKRCEAWNYGEGFFVGAKDDISVLCFHEDIEHNSNIHIHKMIGLEIFPLLNSHKQDYGYAFLYYYPESNVCAIEEKKHNF